MKKFFLSFFVFAASAAYVAYQYLGGGSSAVSAIGTSPQTHVALDTSGTSAAPVTQTPPIAADMPVVAQPTAPATPTSTSTPTPKPTTTPTPAPAPTPIPVPVATPAPVAKPTGQYVDGTYTGAAANAYYGTVQIQVVIQGGKLATVTFLQYPNDRQNSIRINSRAMPTLQQEAIAAQSANVSGASGASYTSAAFKQSLGDALAQAKNS